jgi:hypothetical protein
VDEETLRNEGELGFRENHPETNWTFLSPKLIARYVFDCMMVDKGQLATAHLLRLNLMHSYHCVVKHDTLEEWASEFSSTIN